MNKYRFENGKIYEYCDEQNAYVFYGNVLSFTRKEIMTMRNTLV